MRSISLYRSADLSLHSFAEMIPGGFGILFCLGLKHKSTLLMKKKNYPGESFPMPPIETPADNLK